MSINPFVNTSQPVTPPNLAAPPSATELNPATAAARVPTPEAKAAQVDVADEVEPRKVGKASKLDLAKATTEFDKQRFKAEKAERNAKFDGIDADGDGKLSKQEWADSEVYREYNGFEVANLNAVPQFKDYDKNGDGELSRKEYHQGRKEDAKETARYNKENMGKPPEKQELGPGLDIPDGVILGPSTIWDIERK